MWRATFYKELIKTRMAVTLIFVLAAAAVAYVFIDTAQNFRSSGAVNVWNAVIVKDMPLLPVFMQWLPAAAALLLAFSQFVPEMTDKRLKLTLHLPVSENRTVAGLLAYGLAVLTVLYLVMYGALTVGMGFHYPQEMVAGMWRASAAWLLAGYAVYLLAAWVCIEPVWRQKILNALAAVCLISFFYIKAVSGAYMPFVPYLLVFTVACFAFPFYSAARFKEGAQ